MLELKRCQLKLEQEKWDDQKQHQQQQHDLDYKFDLMGAGTRI
jgi:hypothetical protein